MSPNCCFDDALRSKSGTSKCELQNTKSMRRTCTVGWNCLPDACPDDELGCHVHQGGSPIPLLWQLENDVRQHVVQ